MPQIRLVHSGRQLQDTDSIETCRIEPGGVIHMVLSLRGGSA